MVDEEVVGSDVVDDVVDEEVVGSDVVDDVAEKVEKIVSSVVRVT